MSVSLIQSATRADGVSLVVKTNLTAMVGGVDMEVGAYEDGALIAGCLSECFDKRATPADYRWLIEDRAVRKLNGLRIVEVIGSYDLDRTHCIPSGWTTTVIGT